MTIFRNGEEMGNTSYILIGNGFTLNLLGNINDETIRKQIDLKNLFSKGDMVKWPNSNERGFLSRKYCPDLWLLGARPTMQQEEAYNLINDIITCMNVYSLKKLDNSNVAISENDNVYIRAYDQLCTYLKNLFIYYNNKVDDVWNIGA